MAQIPKFEALDSSPYLFPVYDPTDEEVEKYPFLNGGAAMAKKGRHPVLLHCARRFNFMVIARKALQERNQKLRDLQERMEANDAFEGTAKFSRAVEACCLTDLINARAGMEGMKAIYEDCIKFFQHIEEENNAFGFMLQEVGLGRKYFQDDATPLAPVDVVECKH